MPLIKCEGKTYYEIRDLLTLLWLQLDSRSDLDPVYIVLEITELLAEEYLLPSLGRSYILVSSIATGEGHFWWQIILMDLTADSVICYRDFRKTDP